MLKGLKLILDDFGLTIPVCVISAVDIIDTLARAPDWWNKEPDTKHDAFFVIPPVTADEIFARVGAVKEELESFDFHHNKSFLAVEGV